MPEVFGQKKKPDSSHYRETCQDSTFASLFFTSKTSIILPYFY